MHLNLNKAGKLVPPRNWAQAEKRLQQLRWELQRVEGQLRDDTRVKTCADYDGWRERARKTAELFREEIRQLVEWMDTQLLFDVREFLVSLEEDEFEFSDDELSLVARLKQHLDHQKEKST